MGGEDPAQLSVAASDGLRQTGAMAFTRRGSVRTPVLEIAYEEAGSLRAGLPSSSARIPVRRARVRRGGRLAAPGIREIAPYLRGYGPTRFLDPRDAALGRAGRLGQDLLDLIDGLEIERVVVAGYDWAGRPGVHLAALSPGGSRARDRGGYNVSRTSPSRSGADEAGSEPRLVPVVLPPASAGAAASRLNRHELCRLLWTLWSPNWRDRRHRRSRASARACQPGLRRGGDPLVPASARGGGDPSSTNSRRRIAEKPAIAVPTMALESGADGVGGPDRLPAVGVRFTAALRRSSRFPASATTCRRRRRRRSPTRC